MIGNDIVDLLQASLDSRWQRKGYLDKLFTPAEQAFILSDISPAVAVWTLWSCKEAVYKIIHRLTNVRRYAPLAFVCDPLTGTVSYEDRFYYYKTTRREDCIHTIAVQEVSLFEQLLIGDRLADIQGMLVKNAAGVPSLMNKYPVSISHHGRYSGWISTPKLWMSAGSSSI